MDRFQKKPFAGCNYEGSRPDEKDSQNFPDDNDLDEKPSYVNVVASGHAMKAMEA